MWKKIKAFFQRRAGYGPCFSCGSTGFYGFRRTALRHRWTYSTQEGHKLVRYKAALTCDGLCEKCFDRRAEEWASKTTQLFDDIFEEKEAIRK